MCFCSLIVAFLYFWGVYLPEGGVCQRGVCQGVSARGVSARGCLPEGGVSARGGCVCQRGDCLPEGVSARGGCLLGGVCQGRGVCQRGCVCQRGSGGCLPGGVCQRGVSARGGCTMWPIPSCMWCYLYAASSPTETQHQCSCLYTVGPLHAGIQPPIRGQTDACKLITLPETSFAGGNKYGRFIN